MFCKWFCGIKTCPNHQATWTSVGRLILKESCWLNQFLMPSPKLLLWLWGNILIITRRKYNYICEIYVALLYQFFSSFLYIKYSLALINVGLILEEKRAKRAKKTKRRPFFCIISIRVCYHQLSMAHEFPNLRYFYHFFGNGGKYI